MDVLQSLGDDPLQLLIPVISGGIGWITNVLAIRMMFHPVEFKGLFPPLGWQGIVPANAERLARTAVALVTQRLLDVKELFVDFEPESFVDDHRVWLEDTTRKVVVHKAKKHFPAMWGALSPAVQDQVLRVAQDEVAAMSVAVLEDAREHIADLLDVEAIVLRAMREDPELIGNIFQRIGDREFRFIERSGIWFGFLFGLVQLGVWVAYPAWWVLPFFGFLVGYATNWVAIKLIFDPKEPVRVGPLRFQGLFHRRQEEIAREFAEIMTDRVLHGDSLFHELATGTSRERLLAFVRVRAEALLERYRKHPMAGGLFANPAAADVEAEVLTEVEEEMFRPGGILYAFADRSVQIRDALVERMSVLEADAFESVLRPAFQQDEWKLILAGAALGLVAGVLQVIYLFGDLLLSGT
ncbi:MAG: DUF445 domain-containing protein [Myxococcota bacterium]